MISVSKLAWSSTGAVDWKRGQVLVTLKGKGNFSAKANGKLVGGAVCNGLGGGNTSLSLSKSGEVSPAGELVFSIDLKDRLDPTEQGVTGMQIHTPEAHWTGKVHQTNGKSCVEDGAPAPVHRTLW